MMSSLQYRTNRQDFLDKQYDTKYLLQYIVVSNYGIFMWYFKKSTIEKSFFSSFCNENMLFRSVKY